MAAIPAPKYEVGQDVHYDGKIRTIMEIEPEKWLNEDTGKLEIVYLLKRGKKISFVYESILDSYNTYPYRIGQKVYYKNKNMTIKSNGHVLRTNGNRSSWKKTIVTLEQGSTIDILAGET